mgnify:CR=1 FL=1
MRQEMAMVKQGYYYDNDVHQHYQNSHDYISNPQHQTRYLLFFSFLTVCCNGVTERAKRAEQKEGGEGSEGAGLKRLRWG